MAYDEALTERVRDQLATERGLAEKGMFGGVAFLLDGNMAVGLSGDELMVRVGPERSEEALAQPHTRAFDMTGRPMRGWVLVGPDALGDDAALESWVSKGVGFARSLPAKG
jgi:TfoX/Sxy family transcriptional regulator of competence genes